MQRWETDALAQFFEKRPTCRRLVAPWFHPLQDNPPAVFTHVTIPDRMQSGYDGDLAAVNVPLHVSFPDGKSPIDDPQTTPIFLVQEGETWRVLADTAVLHVLHDDSPDAADYLTPLSASDITSPLRIAPPATPCAGTHTGGSDPTGDVHNPLNATSSTPTRSR